MLRRMRNGGAQDASPPSAGLGRWVALGVVSAGLGLAAFLLSDREPEPAVEAPTKEPEGPNPSAFLRDIVRQPTERATADFDPKPACLEIRRLIEAGELDKAQVALVDVLIEAPQCRPAHILQARLHELEGKPSQARIHWLDVFALTDDPGQKRWIQQRLAATSALSASPVLPLGPDLELLPPASVSTGAGAVAVIADLADTNVTADLEPLRPTVIADAGPPEPVEPAGPEPAEPAPLRPTVIADAGPPEPVEPAGPGPAEPAPLRPTVIADTSPPEPVGPAGPEPAEPAPPRPTVIADTSPPSPSDPPEPVEPATEPEPSPATNLVAHDPDPPSVTIDQVDPGLLQPMRPAVDGGEGLPPSVPTLPGIAPGATSAAETSITDGPEPVSVPPGPAPLASRKRVPVPSPAPNASPSPPATAGTNGPTAHPAPALPPPSARPAWYELAELVTETVPLDGGRSAEATMFQAEVVPSGTLVRDIANIHAAVVYFDADPASPRRLRPVSGVVQIFPRVVVAEQGALRVRAGFYRPPERVDERFFGLKVALYHKGRLIGAVNHPPCLDTVPFQLDTTTVDLHPDRFASGVAAGGAPRTAAIGADAFPSARTRMAGAARLLRETALASQPREAGPPLASPVAKGSFVLGGGPRFADRGLRVTRETTEAGDELRRLEFRLRTEAPEIVDPLKFSVECVQFDRALGLANRVVPVDQPVRFDVARAEDDPGTFRVVLDSRVPSETRERQRTVFGSTPEWYGWIVRIRYAGALVHDTVTPGHLPPREDLLRDCVAEGR